MSCETAFTGPNWSIEISQLGTYYMRHWIHGPVRRIPLKSTNLTNAIRECQTLAAGGGGMQNTLFIDGKGSTAQNHLFSGAPSELPKHRRPDPGMESRRRAVK